VDFLTFSAISGFGADDQNAENSRFQYSPEGNVGIDCGYTTSSDGRIVLTNGLQQAIIYIISLSQFIALTTGLGNMSNLLNPSIYQLGGLTWQGKRRVSLSNVVSKSAFFLTETYTK
jgi:hypothetical protein